MRFLRVLGAIALTAVLCAVISEIVILGVGLLYLFF